MKCTGYFDEETLAVATKRNEAAWFEVFIHETCHMDQFLEKIPAWNRKIKKRHCPLEMYELYTDNLIDVSEDTAIDIQKYCVEIEWDCEKRSVEKIKKFDLGIDTDKYIKKANLYLFLYPFSFRQKKWHSYRKIERNNPNILEVLPKSFLKSPMDYVNIPEEIYYEFKKGINFEETTDNKPDGFDTHDSGSGI